MPGGPATLVEWAHWMRGLGMSNRTVDERIELVIRFERAQQVCSLTTSWQPISAFLASAHFSPGTKQTYHAHLRAWFRWLCLMEHRADDPTIKLRPPKTPRRRPHPVTIDQLETLLATRMHFRTRVMILLASYEGLRASEIARVEGQHREGSDIRVVGKGGIMSYLPVHPLVAEAAARMPASGYWFPSHTRPGQHIAGQSVSQMIGKAMRRAGIAGPPHSLRHFFGTETLRASGGNLIVTKELMRHASVATTAIYTEVDDQARVAAVHALPQPRRSPGALAS